MRLGVELTVERVDVAAAVREQGNGVEETARRIRYARLQDAAQGEKIATAHTADDNLETVLFHLVRGTGPKGWRASRLCADRSFVRCCGWNARRSRNILRQSDRIMSLTARMQTTLTPVTASGIRSCPHCGRFSGCGAGCGAAGLPAAAG